MFSIEYKNDYWVMFFVFINNLSIGRLLITTRLQIVN